MRVPQDNKRIYQNNKNPFVGDLWASMGLDLSTRDGVFRVSPRTKITTDDPTNFGTPYAFRWYNNKYYTLAGSYVFESTASDFTPKNAFSATGGSSPTTCSIDNSDMVTFNGNLYISTNSNSIYKYNGSSWSNFTAGASSADAHMMTPYGDRCYYSTLVSKIYSWDTSDTVATSGTNTLTLGGDVENTITFLRTASDGIWIGTLNRRGGKGAIYKWDGENSTVATGAQVYKLDTPGALAGVVKDDVLYIVDVLGRLLAFNGGTFVELARLPKRNYRVLKNAMSSDNGRFIHPNGMAIHKDKIVILVNNTYQNSGLTVEENFPAGVWEYDPEHGLYHKYSLSLYTSAVTDFGQNRISQAGGLFSVLSNDGSAGDNGSLLMGATLYTDSSGTKDVSLIDDANDTIQKAGYFVTAWQDARQVRGSFNTLTTLSKKLPASTDEIVVKYRTSEDDALEASATFSATDRFTTTDDISDYAVGDEVEILQGEGSGNCVHITRIDESGGTYTVRLDEDVFTTSGTTKVRFQKWVKALTISDQTLDWHTKSTAIIAARVQLKVYMKFTGEGELYRIDLPERAEQEKP